MIPMQFSEGNYYSMIDCPRCDKDGPHFFVYERREAGVVFQCETCLALFTDTSPIRTA